MSKPGVRSAPLMLATLLVSSACTPAAQEARAIGDNDLLTYDKMILELRQCRIETVAYGGPVRVYTFIRTDGTRFVVQGEGDWLEAEQRLEQTVATESAACPTDVMLVIS